MKLVIIDNYDSFTYNLAHALKALGATVDVVRNDCFRLPELEEYDRIVLSPGPGIPEEAGLLMDTIRTYATKKPILGICLGHQAIGEVFGARLRNLAEVFHGVQTPIHICPDERRRSDSLFTGLADELPVGRYHSWVVDREALPDTLLVTALSHEGDIMALRHRDLPVQGVQFHPESVLTPDGITLLANWLGTTIPNIHSKPSTV
jgi:anthranilate synthase component 2